MSTGAIARDLGAATSLPSKAASLTRFLPRISTLAGALSIFGGIVGWELAAQFLVKDKLFLVPPSAVITRAGELLADGSLQKHTVASSTEFVLGFGLAGMLGVLLGLLLGTNSGARTLISPWVAALYSTPTVALSPLLILWFGLDLMSKIVVVFLVSVFPVLVNTQAGIESADEKLVETARAFGAKRHQIFTKILLPSAVPFIVAGLRLGVGRGLVGVVVAELFGARAGLGYLITVSSSIFDMGALFAAVVILAGSGVLSNYALKIAEHKIAPWRAA
jgi:ABC-type nitrate/sulfonate/bicarbonate transport system permease component